MGAGPEYRLYVARGHGEAVIVHETNGAGSRSGMTESSHAEDMDEEKAKMLIALFVEFGRHVVYRRQCTYILSQSHVFSSSARREKSESEVRNNMK